MTYIVQFDYPNGKEITETMPSPVLARQRARLGEAEGAVVAITHEETGTLVYETDMQEFV